MAKKLPSYLILALSLGLAQSASAITVEMSFSGDGMYDGDTWVVDPGATFVGHVNAILDTADVGHGGIQSYGTQVNYDPGILQVSGVTSDAIWFLPETTGFDNVVGMAGSFDGKLGGETVSPVHLFDVNYSATGGGTGMTAVTMEDIYPSNPTFNGFVAPDGFVFDGSVAYMPSDVLVTPIPAGAILFGTGLVGLLGLAKRRRSHNQAEALPA